MYHLRRDLEAHELVHPYLAGAAGIFNSWRGRMTFHGGGIVLRGRAWGVLGSTEAGKTTTLTQMYLLGVPVGTDDLLVLDGGDALTGPRCLDLRAPTWEHFASSLEDVEVMKVRDGERYRIPLPPMPIRLPFAGWALLRDDTTVGMEHGRPADRFRVLIQ